MFAPGRELAAILAESESLLEQSLRATAEGRHFTAYELAIRAKALSDYVKLETALRFNRPA